MSIVKSFSVGNGDMFYIKHGSDNFTIIDCFLSEENKKEIVDEIIKESKEKIISRFISTHPDEDHIRGLKYLNERKEIPNFYCVKNKATKKDETEDFRKYCELRDSESKAFYIKKDCSRKWMNQAGDGRGSSGINILWPDCSNKDFKEALKNAEDGLSPNNISPIIKYSQEDGVKILWMGDLETEFLEKISSNIEFPEIDILLAPHHGRKSGQVPKDILEKLDPFLIVVGEAPSDELEYYKDYNTITQNSAGDIVFECIEHMVHVYVGSENYSVTFLKDTRKMDSFGKYIGSFDTKD